MSYQNAFIKSGFLTAFLALGLFAQDSSFTAESTNTQSTSTPQESELSSSAISSPESFGKTTADTSTFTPTLWINLGGQFGIWDSDRFGLGKGVQVSGRYHLNRNMEAMARFSFSSYKAQETSFETIPIQDISEYAFLAGVLINPHRDLVSFKVGAHTGFVLMTQSPDNLYLLELGADIQPTVSINNKWAIALELQPAWLLGSDTGLMMRTGLMVQYKVF